MYRYVHKITLAKVWHINKMLTTHLPFPPVYPSASLPAYVSARRSISPTQLHSAQRRMHYINDTKDPVLTHQHFCFNFTGYLRLQLLRWLQYFGAFLQNAVAIKSFINDLRKGCPAWAPNWLVKLTPVCLFTHLALCPFDFPPICQSAW
jgi:hypothetical protein